MRKRLFGFITLLLIIMSMVVGPAFAADKSASLSSQSLNAEGFVGSELSMDGSITPLSATNHTIRLYMSQSTSLNKIYSNYTDWVVIEDLYLGEVVLPTGVTHREDLGSGDYRDWVQVEFWDNGPNTWGYGWMVDAAYFPSGGEVIPGGYSYTVTLDDYNEIYRDSMSGYMSVRTENSVTYYGFKTRYSSSIYNSSGQFIKNVPVNSWVWITGPNVVGASHHDWMTIKALSSTETGTLEIFSATTFFDADFNFSSPTYYNFYVRP